MSSNSALRVIDHALSGNEGKDNCQQFIEILGLRSIFPLFMKPLLSNILFDYSLTYTSSN